MTEINQQEAVARAASESLGRLREDQRRVSPDLAVALEALAERAFDRTFHLGDLPRSCGRTPSWLWRHFEAELGCTPKSYLDRFRLETASHLLAEPLPPAYRVSEWVGYRSAAVFGVVFGAWAGETPDAYRQRRLQEKAATAEDPAEASDSTLTAAEHALEELASSLLGPQMLSWPPEARRALLVEGRYMVSPRALIQAALEESRVSCPDDPQLGLELAQLALDTLQDFSNQLSATERAQLKVDALACLRYASRRRQKRPTLAAALPP